MLTILNVDELSVSQEQVEAVREEMGFNDSLPVQFGNWLLDFVRLDFGLSYSTGQPVMQTLLRVLPATAELTIGALLVMLVIAIPLGSLSARLIEEGIHMFLNATFRRGIVRAANKIIGARCARMGLIL